MDTTPAPKPPAAPLRSGLRQFGKIVLLVLVVLIALYFVLTSGAFLKAVVVPRIGQALNAKLSVGKVSLSPFSKVHINQLKVETSGPEPLLVAEDVLVRYSLFRLLSGDMAFNEVAVRGANVSVVQQPDGKSNLDPLLARPTTASTTKTESKSAIDLGKLTVSKALLRYTRMASDQSKQVSEVDGLEIDAENIRNGQSGKLKLSAALSQAFTPPPASTNAPYKIGGRIEGAFDFTLDAGAMPSSAKGDLRLSVNQAEGAFRDLGGLNALLACEVTPTEVRELALRFERGGQRLGQARLRGPIDIARRDARLTLEASGIDRNVLNLVGAPLGIDFGDTSIAASGILDVAQRGALIAATGKGSAGQFSIRQGETATPPLDLALDYQFNINLTEKSAVVHKLSLLGKIKNEELISAALDRSMNLSWGQNVHGLNESVVTLSLKNVKLADWRMILGTNLPTGKLNTTAKLTFQDDGRRVPIELTLQAQDIDASFHPNPAAQIRQGQIELQASGTFNEFRSLLVEHYKLQVTEGSTKLLTASGSAGYDRMSEESTIQLNAEADFPSIVKGHPVPDLVVDAGKVTLATLFVQEKAQQRLSASLAVNGFTGGYREYRLADYETRLESDLELTSKYLTLRRITLNARRSGTSGGSIDLNGRYDRVLTNGQFALNIASLNENCLQPLLVPLLAPRKLASVTINGSATAEYSPSAETTLQLDADITKLLFASADGSQTPPLDLNIKLEAANPQTNKYDLRKLDIALPPTPKATNVIQAQGRFDLSPTNPAPSALNIFAQSLDIGPLYDSFVGKGTAAQPAAPVPATAPEEEPAPIDLPVKSLTANLQIGNLFLRDVQASNILATARLDGGTLRIEPCSLALNGAPVSATATIDLSRPGYVYETSIKATRVPIAPLLTSFAPGSRRITGDVAAAVDLKGAGVTDASLQKNLAGQFDIGSTNLNLTVANIENRFLKTVLNVVVGLPELISRPDVAIGNLLSSLTGGGGRASNSWIDELTQSPIDTVQVRGTVGAGRVDIPRAFVQSAAFQADARGTVTLAPVLTNSVLEIPVAVSLRRAIAEKASLLPANTPTNITYVKLPDFLTIKGSAGDPKADINKLALASLTIKSGVGLTGNTGNASVDTASGIIGAVGDLLGGGAAASRTNAPSAGVTNAPTHKPALPISPLLDLLKKR